MASGRGPGWPRAGLSSVTQRGLSPVRRCNQRAPHAGALRGGQRRLVLLCQRCFQLLLFYFKDCVRRPVLYRAVRNSFRRVMFQCRHQWTLHGVLAPAPARFGFIIVVWGLMKSCHSLRDTDATSWHSQGQGKRVGSVQGVVTSLSLGPQCRKAKAWCPSQTLFSRLGGTPDFRTSCQRLPVTALGLGPAGSLLCFRGTGH